MAADPVWSVVTFEYVVVFGTFNVLDTDERITSRFAGSTAGYQTHRYTCARIEITHRIRAAAAIEHVTAGPADKQVIAASAPDRVVAGAAGEVTASFTSDHGVVRWRTAIPLEIGDRIARGIRGPG